MDLTNINHPISKLDHASEFHVTIKPIISGNPLNPTQNKVSSWKKAHILIVFCCCLKIFVLQNAQGLGREQNNRESRVINNLLGYNSAVSNESIYFALISQMAFLVYY